MSAGAVFLVIVAAMFPTLLVVAIVVKLWEVRKASRWPAVEGKVIASRVESHRKSPGDPGYDFDDTEVSNEPLVEYVYHVDGRKYRGRRITIGEKTSTYELETILARYPIGTAVTVYYDPANPQTAVLERDFPASVWAIGVGCVVASIAVPLLAAAVYFHGVDWLKAHLANPGRAPFVAAAGGFGLAVLLFGLAFMAYVRKAAKWPVTRGRIVAADVQAFQDRRHSWSDYAYRRHYKPSVVYEYEVNGRKYRGDRLTIGVVVSATLPGFARRTAARYPVGTEVDVHYDPNKPGESVLHPRSAMHWLIFVAAGIMLTLAWAVATGRM
jgi:hypothetical protein